MKRIGYWMSEKKRKKIDLNQVAELCRLEGVDAEAKLISLEHDLEEQGPFDVILHKATDILVLAEDGDEDAAAAMRNWEAYTSRHPSVLVLDPLDSVVQLIDRPSTYSILQQTLGCLQDVETPTFVELTKDDLDTNLTLLRDAGVRFPFDQMSIIFNESGLKDVNPPCVAQTFINHNAVLHKIFILGDKHFIVQRPSLKNFSDKDSTLETIFFNSHDVSKPDSASFLNKLDASDRNSSGIAPCEKTINKLVEKICSQLNSTLIGIDIIIENETGVHYIIDVNAFPSYEGVPNILQLLASYIVEQLSSSPKGERPQHTQENGFSKKLITNAKGIIKNGLSIDSKKNGLTTETRNQELANSLSIDSMNQTNARNHSLVNSHMTTDTRNQGLVNGVYL
ncbi:inositol-tetrakisphosphate 1-kinase-like [Anneissia japonica]|uniref:inositol-tetrakisphosphate 1-kinase-like n=1 Tax=Anneissia japonica TaxID=1529436 RepID=UPI001425A991|nr:inositol-tetrakisphosphate 1-kinase-like [Anneissia japonica]